MVRPTRKIDYSTVERLAMIMCTDSEIAHVIGFTPEWVCKRKKTDKELADAIERGREKGKATLRRLQWQLAQNGNATMQIWLGKNHLGQRDKTEHELTGKDGGPIRVVREMSDAELEAIVSGGSR